jgi:hypothetical protein
VKVGVLKPTHVNKHRSAWQLEYLATRTLELIQNKCSSVCTLYTVDLSSFQESALAMDGSQVESVYIAIMSKSFQTVFGIHVVELRASHLGVEQMYL